MTILDQLADHARERGAVLHLRRLLRSLGSRLFVSVRRLLLLRD